MMHANMNDARRTIGRLAAGSLVLLTLVVGGVLPRVHADEAPSAEGRAFESPEAAGRALIDACAKNDDAALLAIFGPSAKDLIRSGDDPVVAKERDELAKAGRRRMVAESGGEGLSGLLFGDGRWPLPIPLVQGKDGQWRFDTIAGAEEILLRRIGRNELRAIDNAKTLVLAQMEYASVDRDGDKVREYAQRMASTPGAQDGLYWKVDPASGEAESPLGPEIQPFLAYIHEGKKFPFGGYYWKILKEQGAAAPGGAHSYLVNGNMIAGFAFVAAPAEYMSTGVMTFLVSHHGKVYQKDLGEDSLETAKAMTSFDPGDGWEEVDIDG